jgi:acyl-coenzyme A thioesterase PaaI-like protein
MKKPVQPKVLSERYGRLLLNLFPPFLFNRIRIESIGNGFRTCRVRVRRSLLTRNLNGTIFGGTIFSAADPFYAVMFWQIFARRGMKVQTWLKSASIKYLKPAASDLLLQFELSADEIDAAAAALERDGRYTRSFTTEALDPAGRACARIITEVYLRVETGKSQPKSAF